MVGEGPIGHGRTASWLFSARKSYLDLLIKQIADNETFAFGFTDVAAGSKTIAKWLFFIALAIFLIVLILGVLLGVLVF